MEEFISGNTYDELFLMPYWRLSEIYKTSSRKDKKALKDSGLYDWRRFILCWFALDSDSSVSLATNFTFSLSYSKWINKDGYELSLGQLRYRLNKLVEEGYINSVRCGTGYLGRADTGVTSCNLYILDDQYGFAKRFFPSDEERLLASRLVKEFRIFERP